MLALQRSTTSVILVFFGFSSFFVLDGLLGAFLLNSDDILTFSIDFVLSIVIVSGFEVELSLVFVGDAAGQHESLHEDVEGDGAADDQGDVVAVEGGVGVGVGDDVDHGVTDHGAAAHGVEQRGDDLEGPGLDAGPGADDANGSEQCREGDAETGEETIAPALGRGEGTGGGGVGGVGQGNSRQAQAGENNLTEHYRETN